MEQVPAYWSQVADYLGPRRRRVALELPASAFGVYTWGNVHDDVLQGLAESPWAVRNVIPLAQPGNVVMLDRSPARSSPGDPEPPLAAFLAAERRSATSSSATTSTGCTPGAPDPAYLRSVLSRSARLTPGRSFGPAVGEPAWRRADGVTRSVTGDGLSARVGSVEVYDVAGRRRRP